MNFDQLSTALQKSLTFAQFEAFLDGNLESIRDFVYTLSDSDVIETEVNFFYDRVFISSQPFKEFDRNNIKSEKFDSLLNILAALYERYTKLTGLIGNLANVQSYLPSSSLKYRLKAICKINDVNNVRTDYIQLFPVLLRILDKANKVEDEAHLHQIIDVLTYYYSRGKSALSERGYVDLVSKFNALFTDINNHNKYTFLSSSVVQNLVLGKKSYELTVKPVQSGVLYPSPVIYNFFDQRVVKPVKEHPLTVWNTTLLGYSKEEIRRDVLETGRTDFRKPYKSLSVDDKVILYCYLNMRKHYFTSFAVFSRLRDSLLAMFSHDNVKPVFIDLGCGPLTSGLALGEFHRINTGKLIKMAYIGIDSAEAMLRKAKSLTNDAVFDAYCSFEFHENWQSVENSTLTGLIGESNPVIINASYLFASTTLQEGDLANFILSILTKTSNVFFIFQNPNREDRNVKYRNFKKHLSFDIIDSHVEKIWYKNDPNNAYEPSYEEVFLEVLKLK